MNESRIHKKCELSIRRRYGKFVAVTVKRFRDGRSSEPILRRLADLHIEILVSFFVFFVHMWASTLSRFMGAQSKKNSANTSTNAKVNYQPQSQSELVLQNDE